MRELNETGIWFPLGRHEHSQPWRHSRWRWGSRVGGRLCSAWGGGADEDGDGDGDGDDGEEHTTHLLRG